jgi:serine O-acetyltransferase
MIQAILLLFSPYLRKYSKTDLYRYVGDTEFRTFLRTYYRTPEYRTIYFFRLAHHYKGRFFLGWAFNHVLKLHSYRFHIQIFPEMKIGDGFFVSHFSNVGISPFATIGRNFNIGQGTSIGQTNRGKKKGVPTIGDDVWIGPNCIIVGGITIGNDVLIAPLTFVNFDIPDHSLVIGNPAVIKPMENATEGYINRRV